MGGKSLIESEGLTPKVLSLWATDASISTIQQMLKAAGIEMTDEGVLRHIHTKLDDPKWREVYDTVVRVQQRKYREMVIKAVTDNAKSLQTLFESELRQYVAMMETNSLTEKQSKALNLLSQTLTTWTDKVTKLARMPEFQSAPGIQVNTQINT